jgi:hypothetical protein
MVRRRPAPGILARQLGQVQPLDHFHNKARQMVLRQPVLHRGRKQIIGLSIYGYETAHPDLANANSSGTLILPAGRVSFEGKVRQTARERIKKMRSATYVLSVVELARRRFASSTRKA